jgi:O-methyltransferase
MANISFIRKFKANFIRFNLHGLVEPFSKGLLNIIYLSKISKWRKEQPNIKFNDFYSNKWDYTKRYKLYEFVMKEENLTSAPIDYLEFGVAQGLSFRKWVEGNTHPDSRFNGFDTFTGLPEDWGNFKAGAMSTNNAMPEINDSRVKFHQGLFQQTLPGFLANFRNDKRKVILLDADLYSSTLYVLSSLAPFLKKNDIVIFDEFAVPQHEFLAFLDFKRSFYMDFEMIAAANNYYFVAFKIK